MFAIMFIRIVWGVWFVGSCFLLGHTLSDTIFSKKKGKMKRFAENMLVTIAWPFMAISPAGRIKITKTMRGLI